MYLQLERERIIGGWNQEAFWQLALPFMPAQPSYLIPLLYENLLFLRDQILWFSHTIVWPKLLI